MGFFKDLKKRLFTLNPNRGNQKTVLYRDTTQVDVSELNKLSREAASKSRSDNLSFTLPPVSLKDEVAPNFDPTEVAWRKDFARQQAVHKYVVGLHKSERSFAAQLRLMQKHHTVNETYFQDLEETLIQADVSPGLAISVVDAVRTTVKLEKVEDPKLVNEILADKLFAAYTKAEHTRTTLNFASSKPTVILLTGVNGSGKTTTIAKLAHMLTQDGKTVLIVAADTFRAGAVEQLATWAKRVSCDIVKPPKPMADPAAVVYKGMEVSLQKHYDVVLVDTAGRIQNKKQLMNQLAKICRVINRHVPGAPHETLLVLDATTGQNGLSQAQNFKAVTNITGIVLTKMDGTARGGITFSIRVDVGVPVKFLGLGEKLDDLLEFNLDAFVYGLTKGFLNNDEPTQPEKQSERNI